MSLLKNVEKPLRLHALKVLEKSPGEFKHFITPEGIRLTPVSIEGDHSATEVINFYMGKNTPDRREYIMNHLVVDAEMLRDSYDSNEFITKRTLHETTPEIISPSSPPAC